MPAIKNIIDWLDALAPSALAESWDNVGLLLGDSQRAARKVMTCLTITAPVVQEAVEQQVDLIVTHHPLPFRPTARITTDSPTGALLWQLIGAQISVYSPHTAYDSATAGINQQWAEQLELREVAPLTASEAAAGGTGRFGKLAEPISLREMALKLKAILEGAAIQYVGDPFNLIRKVAIGCGAADELLGSAVARGCDVFITGEARFHTCLEAQAREIALLLVGHYQSERPGVEELAQLLAQQFRDMTVWPSHSEQDPLTWV